MLCLIWLLKMVSRRVSRNDIPIRNRDSISSNGGIAVDGVGELATLATLCSVLFTFA